MSVLQFALQNLDSLAMQIVADYAHLEEVAMKQRRLYDHANRGWLVDKA